MTIRIIAEGVYDTAHSVFEAHEILKEKPDAVFFELPDIPFQEILDAYSSNRIDLRLLKKWLFKAIQAEEKEVDHELVNKLIVGEIEEVELGEIESEGREVHVMQAARKVGAQMVAMDMPLEAIEKELSKDVEQAHIDNVKLILKNKQLPFVVWELFEIFHYPFYVFERLLHHHAIQTMNPYIHNVSKCRVCRLGTKWDRGINELMIPIFEKLPLSKEMKDDLKIAYVMRKVDAMREKYMASKIISAYKELQRKLKREPRILVIVHLWSAHELENILKDLE